MRKYFKNKFFYIMSAIALLVSIVPMVFYSMGATFILRDAVGVIFTPAQKAAELTAESVKGIVSYFTSFDEIVEENAELRAEVAELKSSIYDAQELEELYEWLSDYLELKMGHTDFEFLAASVTGRESGNYSKILTLDVGSGAGVELAMPVITSDGVVGQVTEVGYTWCKVTTILEANSSVGAYVEKTGDSGVCTGVFGLSEDGLVMLNYLPAESEVAVGDRILSTGFGSVYPRGLCVGYVESVEPNAYSRSLDVKVRSAVDYDDLDRVMIITSFSVTAEE